MGTNDSEALSTPVLALPDYSPQVQYTVSL